MSVSEPRTFTEGLLESLSFWNDQNGNWQAYNSAIGGLAEQVFGIVSDQGSPDPSPIAVTTGDLYSDVPVTSIPVAYLGRELGADVEVMVVNQYGLFQTWTTTARAPIGSSSIPVGNQETIGLWPYDASVYLPTGSQVQVGWEPGWSQLLDPSDCPDQFLPFLGQFIGVPISPSTNATSARARLFDAHAHDRGTSYAVVRAAQRSLIGTQSVVLIERTAANGAADGYHFLLVVRPEEVADVTQLTADVNDAKPGGVMWTLVQTDGWTIAQMEASEPTISALEANFRTIGGLEQDNPGT